MRKPNRIYLSGRVSGLAFYDAYESFTAGEKAVRDILKKRGIGQYDFTIVNPLSLPSIQHSWADYMIRDLMLLKECTHIAMLPGWQDSKGAIVEKSFAEGMGIEVIYLDD